MKAKYRIVPSSSNGFLKIQYRGWWGGWADFSDNYLCRSVDEGREMIQMRVRSGRGLVFAEFNRRGEELPKEAQHVG